MIDITFINLPSSSMMKCVLEFMFIDVVRLIVRSSIECIHSFIDQLNFYVTKSNREKCFDPFFMFFIKKLEKFWKMHS